MVLDATLLNTQHYMVRIKSKVEGCPRGIMVKALDYGIVIRELKIQSRYYVHFRTNILTKGKNPLILPLMD